MARNPRVVSSFSAQPGQACQGLKSLEPLTHYQLFVDEGCRVVLARRSTVPFATVSEIVDCFDQAARALEGIHRADYGLLVDVRGGPGRNDPAFETTSAQHRGKLLYGFAKNAALVATAAGRLQIQRYTKDDGREGCVTDDPRQAFAYLGVGYHPLVY